MLSLFCPLHTDKHFLCISRVHLLEQRDSNKSQNYTDKSADTAALIHRTNDTAKVKDAKAGTAANRSQ